MFFHHFFSFFPYFCDPYDIFNHKGQQQHHEGHLFIIRVMSLMDVDVFSSIFSFFSILL